MYYARQDRTETFLSLKRLNLILKQIVEYCPITAKNISVDVDKETKEIRVNREEIDVIETIMRHYTEVLNKLKLDKHIFHEDGLINIDRNGLLNMDMYIDEEV